MKHEHPVIGKLVRYCPAGTHAWFEGRFKDGSILLVKKPHIRPKVVTLTNTSTMLTDRMKVDGAMYRRKRFTETDTGFLIAVIVGAAAIAAVAWLAFTLASFV